MALATIKKANTCRSLNQRWIAQGRKSRPISKTATWEAHTCSFVFTGSAHMPVHQHHMNSFLCKRIRKRSLAPCQTAWAPASMDADWTADDLLNSMWKVYNRWLCGRNCGTTHLADSAMWKLHSENGGQFAREPSLRVCLGRDVRGGVACGVDRIAHGH